MHPVLILLLQLVVAHHLLLSSPSYVGALSTSATATSTAHRTKTFWDECPAPGNWSCEDYHHLVEFHGVNLEGGLYCMHYDKYLQKQHLQCFLVTNVAE